MKLARLCREQIATAFHQTRIYLEIQSFHLRPDKGHELVFRASTNQKTTVKRWGRECDGTEELRMPEFVCIANRHEHNADVILGKFHAIFLPEPPEGHRCARSPSEDFFDTK